MSPDGFAADSSNSPAKGNHSKRSRSEPSTEEEYLASCLVELSSRPIENSEKPVAAVIPTVDDAPELEPANKKQATILERSEDNFYNNFKCSVCGKTFLTHHALDGHKISIRNNININRTHVCLICGEFFPKGQSLGGHMRCHYKGPIHRSSRKKYQEFDLNIPPAGESKPKLEPELEPELNLELRL